MQNQNPNRTLLYVFLAGMVAYGITALFSIGHHQADEHYQIIEFALYKMGINSPEMLAWEFEMQVRPGIQPFMAAALLNSLSFIGIEDPFGQMAIIRLLTGLFTLLAILAGIRALLPDIGVSGLRRAFIILSPFLWFLPYLAVRFSSETLSGTLFLLGFSLITARSRHDADRLWHRTPWWLIGLILGLSFITRYSTGLMIAGLLLWLFLIRREKWPTLMSLASGLLMALTAGIFLDRWFYGQWCFPAWNSAVLLFTDQGPVFDKQPWWFWFTEVFFKGGLFIGLCLILSYFITLFKEYSHPVIWCSLPLVIFLFIVPHKELRFLFPLAFFMPFVITKASEHFKTILLKFRYKKFGLTVMYGIAFLFILENILLCCAVMYKPADQETVAIRYIRKNHQAAEIILLFNNGGNPFDPYHSHPIVKNFYLPQGLEMHRISTHEDIVPFLARRDKTVLLCLKGHSVLYDPVQDFGFTPVFKSLPDIYFRITVNNWDRQKDAFWIYSNSVCRGSY